MDRSEEAEPPNGRRLRWTRQDTKDSLQYVALRRKQRSPCSEFKEKPERDLCPAGINGARGIGRRQTRQKLADVEVNALDTPLTAGICGGDGDAEQLED